MNLVIILVESPHLPQVYFFF